MIPDDQPMEGNWVPAKICGDIGHGKRWATDWETGGNAQTHETQEERVNLVPALFLPSGGQLGEGKAAT